VRYSFVASAGTRARLSGGLGVALLLALMFAASPVAAKLKYRHRDSEHVNKEPFANIPQGPLQIFISISRQRLQLYSDGAYVTDAPVATGVASHPTPLGIFSVIQKDRFHRSNIYSDAPMPYMQRITWSGVALHEGVGLGHPASHGCIRMPHDFAARLWVLSRLGARVIVARSELRPTEFADAHLFVHKERPAPEPGPVQTAQTIDAKRTTDAATPSLPGPTGMNAATISDPAPVDAHDNAVAGNPAERASVAADPPKADTAQAPTVVVPAATGLPDEDDKPAAAAEAQSGDAATTATDVATTAADDVPMPLAKPAALERIEAAKHAPIAIFISRKTQKIYVRQNFEPLFDAPISIGEPEQPLGTFVFTALNYLDDGSTLRWNVVAIPTGQPREARTSERVRYVEQHGRWRRQYEPAAKRDLELSPPETPEQALARIAIPRDVIDQISELIVPGSSLVVSDQGLGPETGEGTDFIVITH
jgi:L,D-transpeptidase catalytic domain